MPAREIDAQMKTSMFDSIFDAAHDAMTTPWIYLALFLFSMIDAFFPAVPSESLVISAGVFSANGRPTYSLIVLVAALGAFIGDHVSYFVGRFGGTRIHPDSRKRRAFDWAARALHDRGGMVLVVARYIPGGRTAVTLTMGTSGYPLKSFSFFDAIAAISWAVYSATIGYVGGKAFEESPVKGLMAGFAVAIAITVATEAVRHLRARRRKIRP
jgi:membrane-associated protein